MRARSRQAARACPGTDQPRYAGPRRETRVKFGLGPTAAIVAFRELLAVCLEGATCLWRLIHLASAHIGRHRMELEDLVLRDGHEISGKDQEIRELPGFDGTLHVFFPGRERIVVGGDAQRLL